MAIALALAGMCPACSAMAATHVVVIERMSFGTMPDGVVAGDTIEWRNADVVPHTATAKDAGFDVTLAPGASASVVVSHAGRYSVLCTYHPGMTAELRVATNGNAPPPRASNGTK